ncbi:serine/threonine-protein kinase [Neotabrizicola sp. sgz301269]|uniref:serine/threonine-protein kinase n=1 Tax=Neotabrizicola sp. sgz301269 TaxID=3276282 RepID=UPI00376FB079
MKGGKVLANRYEIVRHIGRGGMQEVFLAKDLLLGMDVALKTPQAGQVARRFQKSAIVAAMVNHHNVAKTYDYFEEGGEYFLIEEFVDGVTLDRMIARYGAVEPHLAARIFYQLSKGVGASHHAGVVHRDLKPSNIMVGDASNFSDLKVTDFGIATLTEEVFSEAAKNGELTRSTSKTIQGAIPYMAPEIMLSAPGTQAEPPSDIWALGAMMFQILTDEYPFGVFLAAAANVQNNNRAPWPAFMIENLQYRPLVLNLQELVESCLQQKPEDRPSADQLKLAIAELCYINAPRSSGVFDKNIQNGYSGFVNSGRNSVFYSIESVYGKNRPSERNRDVYFASFPGSPRARAHPIAVLKDPKA